MCPPALVGGAAGRAKAPPAVLCRDCRRDLDEINEYAWMAHNDIWIQALRRARRLRPGCVSAYDLVCISCMERRLGRQLTRSDFDPTIPLNFHQDFPRSPRLLSRMAAA